MPVVFLLAGAAAGSPAPVDLEAELGFGGWIVPGVWIPLRIEVAAHSAVDGELVIRTGTAQRPVSWRHPLRLGAGARQRLDLDVIIDDPREPVVLSVTVRADLLAERTIPTGPLRAAEGIVIGVTDDAAGLEIVTDLPTRLRPAYLREVQLPVRWQAYEGVALVVVRDLQDSRLLPAQREALIHWVAQGGRLLVTGGESLMLQAPWLLDLLPARPGVAARKVALPGLTGSGRPVPVIEIRPRPGVGTVAESGTIAAAHWRYGRGVVTVWAFDPLTPDARAWPARRRLWSSLLEMRTQPAVASPDLGRVLPSSQGLSGRAQAGLAVLMVVYILVVRHALEHWVPARGGWLSLAAVTLIFAGVMDAFAETARGSAIAGTQVTVIETMANLGSARAATYVSVVNPYGGTFRLQAPAGALLRPLERIPVTFLNASNHLSASAVGRGLLFESLQVLPHRAVARIVEHDGGAELTVRGSMRVRVESPVLFLRGRVYLLPDFADELSVVLEPTKWEGLEARGPIPQDLRSQIRFAIYARLREADALRDRPWLLGWVSDARARVTLSDSPAVAALQLLVIEVETDP